MPLKPADKLLALKVQISLGTRVLDETRFTYNRTEADQIVKSAAAQLAAINGSPFDPLHDADTPANRMCGIKNYYNYYGY